MAFPPIPVYPVELDDDFTLYKVYNTTQTTLSEKNIVWSEEISIVPVEDNEIWADNGYATIQGELLYYDDVDRDSNGKVNKLKRCQRNIGGKHTKTNPEGTPIYSFVVAEHHNQLATAIVNTENFIGENFSEDESTLDWRIRNLAAQDPVFNDFACPDVTFSFNIISSDGNSGTVAQYQLILNGLVGSVEVQFGDGTSSTLTEGTHTYAPNATIDPIVIVTNEDCQIVQTPIDRVFIDSPEVDSPPSPFTINVPVVPSLPDLFLPSINIPSVDIAIPPIVLPCLDINIPSFDFPSFNLPVINFPSLISIPTIITLVPNLPSIITLVPAIPTLISFDNVPTFDNIHFDAPPEVGPINFGPVPYIPTVINFGPVPSFADINIKVPTFPDINVNINFNTPSFDKISFDTPPSFSKIGFEDAPMVSVDWGVPPVLSCVLSCPSTAMAYNYRGVTDNEDFDFNQNDSIELQYDMMGFPSEIRVVAPESIPIEFPKELPKFELELKAPESIELKIVDTLKLDVSDIKIPVFFDGPAISGELKVNWGFDEMDGSDGTPCFHIVPCKK